MGPAHGALLRRVLADPGSCRFSVKAATDPEDVVVYLSRTAVLGPAFSRVSKMTLLMRTKSKKRTNPAEDPWPVGVPAQQIVQTAEVDQKHGGVDDGEVCDHQQPLAVLVERTCDLLASRLSAKIERTRSMLADIGPSMQMGHLQPCQPAPVA
jgi:hypothetical protein